MRSGHNFWLGGPIDLRSTRLNCILQDLFRDTLLDHIWSAQICIFGQYSGESSSKGRRHICEKTHFLTLVSIGPRTKSSLWASWISKKKVFSWNGLVYIAHPTQGSNQWNLSCLTTFIHSNLRYAFLSNPCPHFSHTRSKEGGTGLCRPCLSQLPSSMQRFLKFIAILDLFNSHHLCRREKSAYSLEIKGGLFHLPYSQKNYSAVQSWLNLR